MADAPDAARSPPPDWKVVPFSVCCARCGQDIHGQGESVCPACGLEFDWADAVPVDRLTCDSCGYHLYGLSDARCPECGTEFTWEDAFLLYRARQKRVFEYRWRDAPIRPFVATWLRSLNARRFWKSVDIHDPPQTRPLLVMVSAGIAIISVQLAVLQGTNLWVWNVSSQLTPTGWVMLYPKLEDLPMNLVRSAGDPDTYLILRALLPWLAVSFFSLLLFPQSMRAARVRIGHVVRVWAHTCLPMVPLAIATFFVLSATCALMRTWWIYSIDAFLEVLVGVHVLWSIRCAYRFYLRMPHAAGIALASQIIAILGGGFLELTLANNITNTLIFRLFDLMGFF